VKERIQAFLGADTEYQKIVSGIVSSSKIVHRWKSLLEASGAASDDEFNKQMQRFSARLKGSALDDLPLLDEKQKLKREDVIHYDNILRFEEKELLKAVLQDIYSLDIFIAAANVAQENKFVLPSLDVSGQEALHYDQVFHPLIPRAKGNSLSIDMHRNISFLTGANMAGKSTFMKSLGIALFLAHLGFPVPAQGLVFSPREALYTSINLPDDIQMGYSHFYAEVLRIKKVAQQLAEGKKLFVIFDEMFRGTNVKDAFEGTSIPGANLCCPPTSWKRGKHCRPTIRISSLSFSQPL
jgi:DNA mismatch repair protein MutS